VHGGKGPEDTIKTKQQAVAEDVRLAAPCAEKHLLEMGVAAGEIEKLVALLTTVGKNEEKAKAVFEAARPLVRGDFTEATLTALLVALEVPVHGGEGPMDTIKTKQQAVAEVVRLAAPCAEKHLLAMGVAAGEIEKLVALLTAVGKNEEKAKAVFEAARPLVSGEFTEAALTALLVALEVPLHGSNSPGGPSARRQQSEGTQISLTARFSTTTSSAVRESTGMFHLIDVYVPLTAPTYTMDSVGLTITTHTHAPTHTGVESNNSQPECVQEAAGGYYNESSMQGTQTCDVFETTDATVHNPMQVAEKKETRGVRTVLL
jgi:hypothetical protein